MACLWREIHRFERAPTLLLDDVQRLHQAQILHLFSVGARPPSALDVVGERRTTHGGEDHVAPADCQVTRRVPRSQCERRRGECNHRLDQLWVEAHHQVVDDAPGTSKNSSCLRLQHTHAGGLQ